jgi:hypothetical protein
MIVSGNFQGAGVDPGPFFLVPGGPEGPGALISKSNQKLISHSERSEESLFS